MKTGDPHPAHAFCIKFVLDIECDPMARAAIKTYIEEYRKINAKTAKELEQMLDNIKINPVKTEEDTI